MSLQAEIPGSFIKVFSSNIDAVVGFGDELNIEAMKTQFILWTLNMTMTGQAIIRISPVFFDNYRVKRPTVSRDERGRPVKGESLRARVLIKKLRTVFRKNQNILNSLEKCEITLQDPGVPREGEVVNVESRFNIKLLSQQGLSKKHSLRYGETDPVVALYRKTMQHKFAVDANLLNDYLCFFHPKVTDVAIECTPDAVKIKSYYSDSHRAGDRPMHSEFTINSTDFASYQVQRNVQVAFNIKEFKTAINYAVDMNMLLSACFDEPGKPIVFTVELSDMIIADFAIITHLEDPVPTQMTSHTETSIETRSGYR
ncbi:Rad9/Ddc1 [Zychaea mexicana]|uniref:Rad9/Ddc1 n=1 Tax=Zychaea mexicana TaxID=64656 RepID=UPI0022FE4DE7|nr:Rad9/Ddc1 [Zychaea mexicana]KAI9493065.1 Rad9/Ddc1 [Zychaea mexicana]